MNIDYLLKIKNANKIVVFILFLSILIGGFSINVKDNYATNEFTRENITTPQEAPFDWVVLIYLDADNDLEEQGIIDINEMEEAIGASVYIAVYVLIDRSPGYDTSNGDWTDAKLYCITSDNTDNITSTLIENKGELNMGDPTTLEDFLNYGFSLSADHYWLNLWDHGGGVDGICWDDSDGDYLTIDEMQQAINDSEIYNGKSLDVISHDACFMNMIEVAYEIKDLADYFVASEESVPWEGFNYTAIIEEMVATPTITSNQLSGLIVDTYEEYYNLTTSYVTLSALDLSLMESTISALNYFANNLTYIINDGQGCGIEAAFFETNIFYDYYIIDLQHLAERLIANSTLFGLYPDLNSSTSQLLLQLDNLIIYNYQHSCYEGNANGVTIFMPYYYEAYQSYITNYIEQLDSYSGMDWQNNTTWEEFLLAFYNAGFGVPTFTFDELILEAVTETLSIGEAEDKIFFIEITELGIYEGIANVLTGDVDIYILDYDKLKILAYSELYNPIDSSVEKFRLHLEPGIYLIDVYGFEASTYNLLMTKVLPIELELNQIVTATSGTEEGISEGGFAQWLNHYYIIDLTNIGENTITLSYDSNEVDFDLYTYYTNFTLIDFSEEADDNDIIIYNVTEETEIIICVHGYSGYGEFSLQVTFNQTSAPFPGFTFFFGLIALSILGLTIIHKRK